MPDVTDLLPVGTDARYLPKGFYIDTRPVLRVALSEEQLDRWKSWFPGSIHDSKWLYFNAPQLEKITSGSWSRGSGYSSIPIGRPSRDGLPLHLHLTVEQALTVYRYTSKWALLMYFDYEGVKGLDQSVKGVK